MAKLVTFRLVSDNNKKIALNPRYIAIVQPADNGAATTISSTAGYAYGTAWTVVGKFEDVVRSLNKAAS